MPSKINSGVYNSKSVLIPGSKDSLVPVIRTGLYLYLPNVNFGVIKSAFSLLYYKRKSLFSFIIYFVDEESFKL